MKSNVKEKPVCSHCGGDEVLCDAYAEWDYARQEWALLSEFPNYVCNGDCGGNECSVIWETTEGEQA